jgi:hypothetical protein
MPAPNAFGAGIFFLSNSEPLTPTAEIFFHLLFPQLSTINYQLSSGGIAQLVERQLCKLEVRGSNPLASSPKSFRDCRAVALAKADIFHLATSTQRATTRQAVKHFCPAFEGGGNY